MKFLLNLIRVLVGVLFIVSGLVKANDPLSLSYKMKEFFEIWNSGLEHNNFFLKDILINLFLFLHDHSLSLSVFMIVFEIIAGVALLLGWRMKLFSWLLLLLIIFFTFLTAYAFYSGKFTNCGCFGDCLPITPKTSFLKDIVLSALIIFLFAFKKNIQPFFSGRTSFVIIAASAVLSFALQWYVLNYLPFADCLPFKKGNNISEKMKPPPGSVEDSFAIRFIYEKNGKQFEFAPSELPADLNTYSFKDRIDKLVRKGNADPAIKGFSLKTPSGADSTTIILSQPYCLLLFCENFSTPVSYWQKDFESLTKTANQKNIPVYIVTASVHEAVMTLQKTPFSGIQVLECDFTAIRTAARTNPCLYLLKQGTVVNKWSYKRIKSAEKDLP
ncbi:MAG: BT_3928 family protein [Chitinophagales bacterium]